MSQTFPGVREKRLFPLDTKRSDGLLTFVRKQPVYEHLTVCCFHMWMPGGIHTHNAVLVELAYRPRSRWPDCPGF